jgi:N6-L-threonylcarbamoyladenine synthase
MIILAIETSCDETAVAIVEFKKDKIKVLANVISSQVKAHSKFGGVVPALASRMHLKNMVPVLKRAFKRANINKNKIDHIAVTRGPGLIPALMIGVSAAKALSYSLDKPLVGVNHLEGHIYANWLRPVGEKLSLRGVKRRSNPETTREELNCGIATSLVSLAPRNDNLQVSPSNFKLWEPEFPILCLIVSGGHTQLILMKKDLNYKIIGETLDDAAGEAFDKVAKLLNLGYPGGPLIEKIAKKGDENKFNFTRPMINSKDYNFSFSGLKTAVLYEVRSKHTLNPSQEGNNNKYKQDVAASFQQAVIDVLISKTIRAAKQYKVKNIILGGGVSANKELQKQFCRAIDKEILYPRRTSTQGGCVLGASLGLADSNLSTDNALMIAIAVYKHIQENKRIGDWKSVKADANLKIE